MKLLHIASLRFSIITSIVLAFWSVFFYIVIVDEVNDELDDSLEDYAEMIIRRHLAGEKLPSQSIGSNNQYFIQKVSNEYAATHPSIQYEDKNVFIVEKDEFEPARVLSYIFHSSSKDYYKIEVSTPTIDKNDLTQSILWWLVGLYLTINLSIFLINMWTIRRTMAPLRQMLAWLDRYKLGKSNDTFNNDTKIYEFQKLNNAITQSMKRNEAMYQQQQMFISNASHEIQTPLAVCLNRIEMMLDDANLSEQQMGEILKIRRSLSQLSRMNRELLLLCKIDNGQYSLAQNINIAERITEIIGDQEMIFSHKEISVNIIRKGDLIMLINDTLATVLLTNLIKNAYTHNIPNGKIDIEIDFDKINISNTGSTTPLDRDKIFMRFYHTPTNQSSSGLGLAIVKAICNQNNLDIEYSYKDNIHSFCVLKKDNQ